MFDMLHNAKWSLRCVLHCGVLLFGMICVPSVPSASAQDWFRAGTGLGVSKARVAMADLVGASPSATPLGAAFSEVVRNDLDYSGILEMVSKSFYPLQSPAAPANLD